MHFLFVIVVFVVLVCFNFVGNCKVYKYIYNIHTYILYIQYKSSAVMYFICWCFVHVLYACRNTLGIRGKLTMARASRTVSYPRSTTR